MTSPPVGLDAAAFARVFPHHVGFDAARRIVQHGARLPALCPGLAIGDALEQHLAILRPEVAFSFTSLPALRQQTFVMRGLARGVQLRGPIVLSHEAGPALYLCAPWVTNLAEAGELGLAAGEDVMQAGLLDLLFTLSLKETALADAERMATRLREERAKLQEANVALQRASRLRDEFLAAMSHELRTPLNAILGMSEALAEQAYGALSPRQHEVATEIATSGRRLLALINDLLDLSRIGAGRLSVELQPTSVRDACLAAVAAQAEAARRKGVDLAAEGADPAWHVDADARRLRQLLVALVDNAVKFTPVGGRIRVGASSDGEGRVHLHVTDTGLGIAAADHERIFEPFVQLDGGLDRRFGGTGLGLALARRIAELFGATLGVCSAPGDGSTFTLRFPRSSTGRGGEDEAGRLAAAVEGRP